MENSSKPAQRFREFARRLKNDDAAVREFLALIKGDRKFPDVATWQELRWYLNKTGAPHSAFIGARLAWRRYKLAEKERLRVF